MEAVIALAKTLPEPVKKPLKFFWSIWFRLSHTPLEFLPHAPDLFRAYRQLQSDREVTRRPGGWIYRGKFYPDYLTIGGASPVIYSMALKYCQGQGIDIGAGFWPLPGAIPVDLERGVGSGRKVADFDDLSLDYVFSSHCLEHIENWQPALIEWIKKLKPGGRLFLYLPHPECAIWHPGSPFVGTGHKWIPRPEIIKVVLGECKFNIVAADDGPDAMQSFFVCASKPSSLSAPKNIT